MKRDRRLSDYRETGDYRRNGYFGVGWGTIIPQSRVGNRRLFYLGKSAKDRKLLYFRVGYHRVG